MQSYREMIERAFEMRRRKNPRYSLRALARDLEIESSRLSEVLSGKQGLSRSSAEKIAEKLAMSKAERDLFCELVDVEHARSLRQRSRASERVAILRAHLEVENLKIDSFEMIAGWYHLPILELTTLQDFVPDESWMAAKLEISHEEAVEAVQRLLRMGFLKKENGTFISAKPITRTQSPPEKRSEGIKQYHLRMMDIARKQIEVGVDPERDVSNLIVSIPSSMRQEFKERIGDFRRAFAQKCDALEGKDRVYCLSIQFIPLSRSARP